MKLKKRALLIIIGLILSFSIQQNALASGSNFYNIEKIDMIITIPSRLIVFTQDSPPNDPNFSYLGLDGYSLIQSYKDSNIYLNAISDFANDGVYEIVVTMLEYDGSKEISDFRRYSDSELKSLVDEVINSLTADNITFLSYDLYEHSQAKFVALNIKQPDGYGGTAYGKQYYTILGGRAINITLHSYEGALSTAQKNLVKQVVDSVEFGASYPKQAANTSTALFSGALSKGVMGAISGGIIAAAIMLYHFIKKSVKKASAKKQGQLEPNSEVGLSEPVSIDDRVICDSCGATLLSDSVFCDKCGQKVR